MGQSSQEIQAKLGVDGTNVPKDLAEAKAHFDKFGKDVASEGSKHGESFGDHFGEAIGKKLGAHHLGGAVAAALGINIEKIADGIAEAIVGGSKEGWEEAGKIAEENAKLISEIFRDAMSPKQLRESLQKELEKAIEEAGKIKGKLQYGGEDGLTGGAVYKEGALDAEQLKDQLKLQNTILELTKKINDLKKDDRKDEAEYQKAVAEDAAKHLEGTEKILALNKEINDILEKIVKGGLTDGEVAKLKIQLLEKEGAIKDENLKLDKKAEEIGDRAYERIIKQEKAEAEAAKKLTDLRKSEVDQQNKVANDRDKLTDRSKLTISELANLQNQVDPNKNKSNLDLTFGANEGLTSDQIALKKRAKEAEDQAAEVERLRLSGRQGEADEALKKLDDLRSGLVSSGAVKSTEDPTKQLIDQLKSDTATLNKTQEEIRDILSKKFVNE